MHAKDEAVQHLTSVSDEQTRRIGELEAALARIDLKFTVVKQQWDDESLLRREAKRA